MTIVIDSKGQLQNKGETMKDCELSMERLLKTKEAIAVLNISPRKFWELTNTGEIPPVRFGRAVRFDPADLKAYTERHKGERK